MDDGQDWDPFVQVKRPAYQPWGDQIMQNIDDFVMFFKLVSLHVI